jgi:hypothetical protein
VEGGSRVRLPLSIKSIVDTNANKPVMHACHVGLSKDITEARGQRSESLLTSSFIGVGQQDGERGKERRRTTLLQINRNTVCDCEIELPLYVINHHIGKLEKTPGGLLEDHQSVSSSPPPGGLQEASRRSLGTHQMYRLFQFAIHISCT